MRRSRKLTYSPGQPRPGRRTPCGTAGSLADPGLLAVPGICLAHRELQLGAGTFAGGLGVMWRTGLSVVKRLFRRWWVVALAITVIVVAWGVSLSFTGDLDSGVSLVPLGATTATETPAPAARQVPAVPSVSSSAAADQGWIVLHYFIFPDALDNFAATFTVTNGRASPRPGFFTVTVRRAGKVVATLRGFVASTPAHRTVPVQMISLDHYVPGTYKIEFRSNFS
jgi:hypothetical protein